MNDIAVGSARTEPERQVEKALAAVTEWEGLNVTYSAVTGGLLNSNWRITVESKEPQAQWAWESEYHKYGSWTGAGNDQDVGPKMGVLGSADVRTHSLMIR